MRTTAQGLPNAHHCLEVTREKKKVVSHVPHVSSRFWVEYVRHLEFGMNSSCNAVAIKNMNCECIRRPRKQAVREKGTVTVALVTVAEILSTVFYHLQS